MRSSAEGVPPAILLLTCTCAWSVWPSRSVTGRQVLPCVEAATRERGGTAHGAGFGPLARDGRARDAGREGSTREDPGHASRRPRHGSMVERVPDRPERPGRRDRSCLALSPGLLPGGAQGVARHNRGRYPELGDADPGWKDSEQVAESAAA